MLPECWAGVRRILAVRLDNIGDVVMLGPALRALREALPAATITLLASPAGSQVAPLLPWIDDVITERVVWQDASGRLAQDPAREWTLVQTIRGRGFDAAVIFTSFSQSPHAAAYVCYLAGIPVRLGQSKEFGGAVLSQAVRPLPDSVHQAERNLHLVEATGILVRDRQLELGVPGWVQAAADRKLREAGLEPQAPFLVLAPGASCPARRYDLNRFAEVARLLATDPGLPLVVVGHEREAALIAPVLRAAPATVSLIGRTSVPELAAIVGRATGLLANDSGPMHMGDAFGIPMVILYSGTELEEQWRPRRAPARLLRRPTPCSPCYAFECPYQMECLDIPPAEVAATLRALLTAAPAGEEAGRHLPALQADSGSAAPIILPIISSTPGRLTR